MDKKDINSPGLTGRFVIFITGFVVLMLLVAHYLLKWF
jgi:preprotein translocase subunit Sec61beta